MHTMIALFSMDPTRKAEQTAELQSRLVPLVQKMPGFVSGSWSYDNASNMSYSHIVLRSEMDAKNLADFIRGTSERAASMGVHLERISIAELLATA